MLVPILVLLAAAPGSVGVKPLAGGDALSEKAARTLTAALSTEVQKRSGKDLAVAGGAADEVVAPGATWDGKSLVFELRLLDGRGRARRVVGRSFEKGTAEDLQGALPAMVAELFPPAPSPAPAAAAAPAATADRLVIHYHRRDGRYGPAALYAWETFQRGDELREDAPGIAPHLRPPTVDPDGKDGFGIYWVVQTARYRNGRVNFRVRSLDGWDECGPRQRSDGAGKALFWIAADGPEVWLDVPECELFPTREAAERAQAK